NDAGEKLSILAGTLARLDRPAPDYGLGRYNDFNTHYLQAASSTSGGSSGSPVVDITGHVVALNAGARNQAASSFFLPLARIVRALKLLQAGKPVPRGTLQTTFAYTPFDELRRLGLRQATEKAVRSAFPEVIGLLVVRHIVPGSPAAAQLELGDILCAVNGQPVAGFVAVEDVLDARVGEQVALSIERGGVAMEITIVVDDLHRITPTEFIEVGGAVLHDLSYQRARTHQVPLHGVYVANKGYVFADGEIDRGSIITAINGTPTPTLAHAIPLVTQLAHGESATLRFFNLDSPPRKRVATITMDRQWFRMQRSQLDPASGRWVATPCADPSPPPTPVEPPAPNASQTTKRDPGPASEIPRETDKKTPEEISEAESAAELDARQRRLARSLVAVEFAIPFKVDGVHGSRFHGAGLILDHQKGLLVTSRATVPIALGDVRLTFAGTLEIPGEIVLLHPLHNLAMIRYDPALLGETQVSSVELADTPALPGDKLLLVALRRGHHVLTQSCELTTIEPLELPLPQPPRFREANFERIAISASVRTRGGALFNEDQQVVALWCAFSYQKGKDQRTVEHGLCGSHIRDLMASLANSDFPTIHDLGVELGYLPLAQARRRGLSQADATRLESHDPKARSILQVQRISSQLGNSPWQVGDLILSLGGAPITRFRALETAAADGDLAVEVLRDGAPVAFTASAMAVVGRGTERIVHWGGALLQAPHRAAMVQRAMPPDGVYVSLYWYGSPAARSKIRAARLIVAVDGQPTPNLDRFIEVVRGRPDRASVRLKTIDLEGKALLLTLRLDLHYFPTYELRRTSSGWKRYDL
ncbi:MAG: PDZ domain-containing protein, partial [Nannocystaceae bacterium]